MKSRNLRVRIEDLPPRARAQLMAKTAPAKPVEAEPKKNKFFAQKATGEQIEFDSRHERDRFLKLYADEIAGLIRELKLQVPMQVHINDTHVFTYLCDFVYERESDQEREGRTALKRARALWVTRHEDAKGYRKGAAYQLFRLKKAVIFAAMNIDIEEV